MLAKDIFFSESKGVRVKRFRTEDPWKKRFDLYLKLCPIKKKSFFFNFTFFFFKFSRSLRNKRVEKDGVEKLARRYTSFFFRVSENVDFLFDPVINFF